MYASKYAKNEWIFVLDADETFETKLHQELNDLVPTSTIKAYKVKRINYFLIIKSNMDHGKMIRLQGYLIKISANIMTDLYMLV